MLDPILKSLKTSQNNSPPADKQFHWNTYSNNAKNALSFKGLVPGLNDEHVSRLSIQQEILLMLAYPSS